jgi:hypothetical protein
MTIMGMKRDPNQKRKPLRRIGHTRRGEEERCLRLLKKVIVQEYHEALGTDLEVLKRMELDHIHGRHHGGFRLGAMLDPLNLQLVPGWAHQTKTNATESVTGITQRHDFRKIKVETRLAALSDRLFKKLGPLKFTAKEFRKALRGELYG